MKTNTLSPVGPRTMEQLVRDHVQHLLRQIFPLIGTLDWWDTAFDLKKALVCARLAALAYAPITKEEATSRRRTTLVPCRSYQTMVQLAKAQGMNTTSFVASALEGMEEFVDDFFIYEGRSIVAVALYLDRRRLFHRPGHYEHDAMFIAVRGTKFLYDWGINVRAWQVSHRCCGRISRIHRGFYEEAAREGSTLLNALAQWRNNTFDWHGGALAGHSLGGAIAAIWHGLHTHDGLVHFVLQGCDAYTFGVPRYADRQLEAMGLCRTKHIVDHRDIVPHVPPRLLPISFRPVRYVDGQPRHPVGEASRHKRARTPWGRWLVGMHTAIEAHSIESYIGTITEALAK